MPRALIATLALLLTGGCAMLQPKSTITEHQARDRVESYIQGALSTLPPGTGREWSITGDGRSECLDPTDNGPLGRYEISADYRLTGLDPARYPDAFTSIIGWWQHNGFTILHDERPRPDDAYMFARHNNDAFSMSIQANDRGEMYVGATSTCVWPNGTPGPSPSPTY